MLFLRTLGALELYEVPEHCQLPFKKYEELELVNRRNKRPLLLFAWLLDKSQDQSLDAIREVFHQGQSLGAVNKAIDKISEITGNIVSIVGGKVTIERSAITSDFQEIETAYSRKSLNDWQLIDTYYTGKFGSNFRFKSVRNNSSNTDSPISEDVEKWFEINQINYARVASEAYKHLADYYFLSNKAISIGYIEKIWGLRKTFDSFDEIEAQRIMLFLKNIESPKAFKLFQEMERDELYSSPQDGKEDIKPFSGDFYPTVGNGSGRHEAIEGKTGSNPKPTSEVDDLQPVVDETFGDLEDIDPSTNVSSGSETTTIKEEGEIENLETPPSETSLRRTIRRIFLFITTIMVVLVVSFILRKQDFAVFRPDGVTQPDISTSALQLAVENNISWLGLQGSGTNGQIVDRDVLEYLAQVEATQEVGNPTPEAIDIDFPKIIRRQVQVLDNKDTKSINEEEIKYIFNFGIEGLDEDDQPFIFLETPNHLQQTHEIEHVYWNKGALSLNSKDQWELDTTLNSPGSCARAHLVIARNKDAENRIRSMNERDEGKWEELPGEVMGEVHHGVSWVIGYERPIESCTFPIEKPSIVVDIFYTINDQAEYEEALTYAVALTQEGILVGQVRPLPSYGLPDSNQVRYPRNNDGEDAQNISLVLNKYGDRRFKESIDQADDPLISGLNVVYFKDPNK